jgi:hypothetical protein
MWGLKRHGLVSAGMTFVPHSEQWGPRITATVTCWYQCQCGQTYGTQSTCEFGSEEGLENLVSGSMSAVEAGFSRLATAKPSPLSCTGLQSSLTQILTQLRDAS